MRVSQISVYENRVPKKYPARQSYSRPYSDEPKPESLEKVSFKSGWGKLIGGIAGTAAIIVAAPAVAMVGLAGIGTIAGLAVGHAIDEKIEESQSKHK